VFSSDPYILCRALFLRVVVNEELARGAHLLFGSYFIRRIPKLPHRPSPPRMKSSPWNKGITIVLRPQVLLFPLEQQIFPISVQNFGGPVLIAFRFLPVSQSDREKLLLYFLLCSRVQFFGFYYNHDCQLGRAPGLRVRSTPFVI